MVSRQSPHKERRSPGRDPHLHVLRTAGTLGWICLIAGALVLVAAKPETQGFFDRVNDIQRRLYWKRSLLPYALNCFLAALGFSIAGLAFNASRLKRQGDFIYISVILLGVASLASIIGYFLAFSG